MEPISKLYLKIFYENILLPLEKSFNDEVELLHQNPKPSRFYFYWLYYCNAQLHDIHLIRDSFIYFLTEDYQDLFAKPSENYENKQWVNFYYTYINKK